MALATERRLTIVAPRGYPWAFNGPRQSRHDLRVRKYLPLNRVLSSLDGVTAFSPADTIGAHLIHAFNRIPLNRLPFIIGFESHLPRVFGHERSAYERFLWGNLLSQRCRRIVAISQYAASNFRDGLETAALSVGARAELLAKLEVRYPNLPVPAEPADLPMGEEIVLTFVGNHFARKGGCVAVRIAELARLRGLPIRVNIVSTLASGGPIWTDPERPGFYERYLKLLSLSNVRHIANLGNAEVKRLLAESHFSLLTTFGDTFGFSALESMSMGTPVLATQQGALPEVIDDGVSGLLLQGARTPGQRGWIWPYSQRADPAFEDLFADHVERLATQGLDRLMTVMSNSTAYAAMRRAAHAKALHQFDSKDAQRYWDAMYLSVVDDRRTRPSSPVPDPVGQA